MIFQMLRLMIAQEPRALPALEWINTLRSGHYDPALISEVLAIFPQAAAFQFTQWLTHPCSMSAASRAMSTE